MLSLVIFLLLFTATTCTARVNATLTCDQLFTELPEPAQATLGTEIQIRCSAIPEYELTWLIYLPNGFSISTSFSDAASRLRLSGMSFSKTANETLLLTVNGTEDNSKAVVQCMAHNITYLRRCYTPEVQVIFHQAATIPCDHVFTENPKPVQARIGTKVQLRCSCLQEFRLSWVFFYPNGAIYTSTQIDAGYRVPALGLSVEPFAITVHESVLTVNGTERNNGVKVQCRAYYAPTGRICASANPKVSVIFNQAGPPDPTKATPADLGVEVEG